jgi:replicative DNA helicase
LAGEDSQEELGRRTVSAIKALWSDGSPPPEIDNFIPVSVMGELGPLMQLDEAGNPVNAPAYDWLCKTLANLPDVEVLVLDPKSKFYGLVENDNSHNAAWINCLESLATRFKITILFSHHESKLRAGSMDQASSRGGSALTDGCRWVANLKTMDLETAKKFQVAEPHNYVVLDVTKSNYAPKLPAPIYFRRGAGGVLTYVDLAADRVRGIAEKLLDRLAEEEADGRHFSRRDLLYEKEARRVIDKLKEEVVGFQRLRDINWAVNHLLEGGWLKEIKVTGAKTGPGKTILQVIATADSCVSNSLMR